MSPLRRINKDYPEIIVEQVESNLLEVRLKTEYALPAEPNVHIRQVGLDLSVVDRELKQDSPGIF